MAGILSRTLERLTTTHDDEEVLADDRARAGCEPISQLLDRQNVSVHGVLRSVTLRPVGGVCALEAELFDGSEAVTLVWLGRRSIEGVTPGRRLTARGRLGRRQGERVLYNPHYDLSA